MDASKAEDEVSHFLSSLVLLMQDCVVKHIAHAGVSINDRSPIVVEILCRIEGKPQDIVSSETVLGHGSLDARRFPPACDVLLLS